MKYLSIKEWATYQHYTKRHPPWIKLHARLLDNYAFLCLQDASKAHLLLLWVLASKLQNRIPYDLVFITSKIGATTAVDIEELVLQGFIEVSVDDGKMLAPRTQMLAPKTEAEGESKKKQPASRERYAFMSELRPIWREAYGGEMPKGSARDLEELVIEHGLAKVVAHFRNYVAATPAQYVSLPKFKQTFGTWATGALRASPEVVRLWTVIETYGFAQATRFTIEGDLARAKSEGAIVDTEAFKRTLNRLNRPALRDVKTPEAAYKVITESLAGNAPEGLAA